LAASPSRSDRSSRPLIVLGFDTATADTAVCAVRDGEALHESLLGPSAGGRPRHATVLLEEIERAVAAAGGWGAVELIVAGLGPGSFTGVRIALATARALGASTGATLTGVCTLDAIGRALDGGLAVLDARRGEAFAALYGQGGERLWEPFVATPEELAGRIGQLSEPPRAAGSGALRFRQELAGRGAEIPDDADPIHRVAARHLCALAAERGPRDAGPLSPIYLRAPDAVRWRERDAFPTAK
jgi:tRNA threonylcarbamoyladenosine biosynthesis protein TsaB